ENPGCRNRYVCIQPGYALDCCGHDILVVEEDCVDLTQLDAIKELVKKNDTEPKTLQICIRYKECPTEPIPVLYDDCGCDTAQCAPNRVLESYEIDVNVVTQPAGPSPDAPGLIWKNSVNVAHASAAAYHDSTRRLYVLTDDPQGFVYQASTDNYSVLSSHALGRHALTLAVANDGSRVYVVSEGANAGDPRQLHVLDATQPGLPLVQANPLDIPNSSNGAVLLSVPPDNRLLALVAAQAAVIRWDTDINTQASPAAPTTIAQNLGANQQAFVLGTDGSHAFTGGVNNAVQSIVLATGTATAVNVLPAGAASTAIAVTQSSTGDLLAIVDHAASKLYLINPASPSLVGTVSLDHPPVGLAISPDGQWAYVVEQDTGGTSFVEAVDLFSVQAGKQVTPGAALNLGSNSKAPVISSSGNTLYVPYTGNLQNQMDGGVAILDIEETECCDKIWKSLDGCPSCEKPNCVVLATIKNFVINDTFEDQTDPPSDPAQDLQNHIARINNREGRRLLPSTSTLAEIIECLCARGGGKGEKGDPGLPGAPGKDGKDGKDGEDGKNGTDGKDGKDGEGLERGLTRIRALSWTHNGAGGIVGVTQPSGASVPGIVIAFTNGVHVNGAPAGNNPIDAQHIFQVFVEDDPARNKELGFFCHCPIAGNVVPVDATISGNKVTKATQVPPGDAKAIAFLFDERAMASIKRSSDVWVKLHCDFVIDVNEKAVDGPFLRAQLPTGDHMGTATTPPSNNPLALPGPG
ncbi:MAG TPA: hypothetical protein VEK84_10455, partial [Terriglobales bacterium]|nr:hypothetical protein [Terriglobales bacterium]